MEILKTTTEVQKVVETIVQNGSSVYIVKDYYQGDSDKIIDTVITTKDGYAVDDPAEFESIIEFLEEN
jgi:hypothetical protein